MATQPIALKKRMPDLADYMSTEEAAKRLNLHIETIRGFLRDKTLDGLKVGRSWIVSKKSVQSYIDKTSGMNKFDPRRQDVQ